MRTEEIFFHGLVWFLVLVQFSVRWPSLRVLLKKSRCVMAVSFLLMNPFFLDDAGP